MEAYQRRMESDKLMTLPGYTKNVDIPSGSVGIVHVCEVCDAEAHWNPSDFANSGTPICGNEDCDNEGEDMPYTRTYLIVSR
jgi:hypothetical protein